MRISGEKKSVVIDDANTVLLTDASIVTADKNELSLFYFRGK
jgi:hypothetical protein